MSRHPKLAESRTTVPMPTVDGGVAKLLLPACANGYGARREGDGSLIGSRVSSPIERILALILCSREPVKHAQIEHLTPGGNPQSSASSRRYCIDLVLPAKD